MKQLLILFCFLSIQTCLFSQNKDDYFKVPQSPVADQPDWAQMMYGTDPNAYEVDRLFEKYYSNRDYSKTLHGQNYKFWRKAIEPYLNKEGKIRAPSQKEEEAEFQRIIENKNNPTAESSTANWINIGPFETYKAGTLTPNSNQVNVYALDQSLSHPNILYCGTESSGAFKTTDKGLNWTLISANEVFVGGLSAIKIHPTDPDNVFLCGNNRIYETTDGGTTWTEKYYTGSTGNEIKFHPTKPDTLFVTASNGFYKSEDGGDTWTKIYSDGCWDVDFHPTNPDTVYLLKRNNTLKREEFFMSSDEGQTWTLKDMGWYSPAVLAEAGMNGGKIAVSPVNPNKVWVCLIGASKANDNGWIGVYRSTDRGENWTNLAGQDGGPYAAINDPNSMWNVAAYSSGYHQGFYNFDCEASHNNEDVIWIGTIRLTESADGGMTFEGIGAANSNRLSDMHADIQDIEVIGNDIWVASDGGINYSNDELMSHESRKKGVSGSNFWGFGSGWNEDVLVGGRYHNGNHGYYQTYGVGNSHKIGGVEESTGYVNPIDARRAYFSQGWTGDTKQRKLPPVLGDDYTTLSNVNILPNEHYIESYSSRLYFDYRYANHIYTGSGSSFWKSTDGGVTFSALYDFGTDGRVLEIEQSRDNYDVFYLVFKPNGTNARDIYRSSDGGNTWTKKTNVPTNNRNKLEITTNPKDENEIWVCANDASNGNEVYKSLDGGTSWTNMTTSTLDGEHMIDIYYQGGTDDVVYLMSRNKVWYYDKTTTDWIDYSTGLPLIINPLQMRPFYRDNKMRVAGGRGIYESPMAITSDPIAQPITQKDSVFCSRDTIQFDCYSMMTHAGASWEWTFTPTPMYVSSLTTRNPKVVFGMNGDYDVSLKVTDGSGKTDTRAISKMVTVESHCEVDTIPDNALRNFNHGDYMVVSGADLTNITHFTTTAWIKADSSLSGFSGIVSSGDWCAHCDDTEGLIVDYWGSRLWYKWDGTANTWASNSGMDIPLGEWAFVGLVIYPDSAVLYLNYQRYVKVAPHNPGNIQNLHIGYGHYSKSFRGDIDEVTIWNRALTQDEIRELRHLTKEDVIPTDPNLIAYFQFSEIFNGQIMDHAGSYHGSLNNGAIIAPSSAPIGGGISQRLTLSENTFEYDFDELNAKLFFSDCENPSGEIVLTRINIPPNTLPNGNTNVENYWIINGYEGSQSFSTLDSIQITPEKMDFANGLNSVNDAILYTRNSPNEHLNNWVPKARAKSILNNTFTYHRGSQISMPSQLFLTNGGAYFDEIDPGKDCEVDTIPGNSMKTFAQGDWVQTPHLNFTTDTLTIAAWVKPTGYQNEYSGILFNDITSAGFNFREGNNTLGYHWPGGAWWWDSGLEVPADEWSHVAMVATPNGVTVYLNGVGATHNTTLTPVFFEAMKIGSYKGWNNRNFFGEIDEVALWRRALSQDEIRELIHLTHEDIVGVDSTLHLYLQFNESTGLITDKSGNKFHSSLAGNTIRTTSNAPVGGGSSERMDVTSGGIAHFQNTGIKLNFPSSGTYPDGELVTYRLNVPPDQHPTTDTILNNGYWIIRNYGTNSTFSALDGIEFENTFPLSTLDENSPGQFALYKRQSNDFGNTWGSSLANAQTVTSTGNQKGDIEFGSVTNITEFSQFAIADSRGVKVSLKAFLQGPFNGTNMTDALRTLNYVPLNEPYTNLNFNHKNGGGAEMAPASLFNITEGDAIVDWIFVELRDKNDDKNVLYTRAALLQRDGDVVDIDGSTELKFHQAIPDDYYVALRHRNHLGIMTLNTFSLSPSTTSIDFTSNSTQVYGTNGLINLGGNVMGLWQGDVNNDGEIRYNGKGSDRVQTLLKVGYSNPNNILSGYHIFDVNMDGMVKYNGMNNDREAILLNLGTNTPNNVLLGQLPK